MKATLPGPDKRIAVIGSTGSGKTFAGVFHLSVADFHIRPWIIFDFKGDALIGDIGATELDIRNAPPKSPGVYVVRPIPGEDDLIEAFLWKVWANENTGIYIDEGYMMPAKRGGAFIACLTQGRSKYIQMIVLSQRPSWMTRFVFSEADFFQIFRLNDKRDYEIIQSMISVDIKKRVDRFYSHYYDVGEDMGYIFGPVPNRAKLIETFKLRLKKSPRVL